MLHILAAFTVLLAFVLGTMGAPVWPTLATGICFLIVGEIRDIKQNLADNPRVIMSIQEFEFDETDEEENEETQSQ